MTIGHNVTEAQALEVCSSDQRLNQRRIEVADLASTASS
jgi:hypothetical protein